KPKDIYDLGNFKSAHVYGGNDWLIIQYTGEKYTTHCNKKNRISIFYIGCDQSATTPKKRKPRIIEEYRPNEPDNDFCYYLFEMKHNGVCPPEKSKISPGSVFIIIIAIIVFLYLLLGFLYQRFIVGAKGMEQIPNYLMWREFGALQADGCNYICRGRGRKEPTRYKPMDDAIADDDFSLENDDNDDTMLPM
ncbi:cation-dependent mannose-6-phosphate receptor-like, partial [Xenia sp. Carnegie-2017]|uniref:cation-dependent mannose-6-phosphate receptor-like n=1 Tax=Xenia sp. Carnegie-2017 TaxID=2897299 RepID=UPI001F046713